jgi:hypothetical protein
MNNDINIKGERGGREEEEISSTSPILSTRYAHKAAKMIHSLEGKFIIVIGVIFALFVFALIDIIQIKGYVYILADEVNDIIIITFAAISIVALIFVLRLCLKSKKLLNNWANVFERNSIRAGISITMANKTKEEAILAVSEIIEPVGEPLQNYISSSKDNLDHFIDVTIRNERSHDKLPYDVLIDADHIVQTTTTTSSSSTINESKNSDNLKSVLKEYGAIIIKIADGKIERESLYPFFDSLSRYISVSKNDIGLALMIGEDVTQDANHLATHFSNTSKRIQNIVLVEKPMLNRS